MEYIEIGIQDPKPFVWTKTADRILANIARSLERTSASGHWTFTGETIRFMKQGHDLEDSRLLSYERLRTIAAMVRAAAYFTCVQLGSRGNLRILRCQIDEVARRIAGIAELRSYAIADGTRQAL